MMEIFPHLEEHHWKLYITYHITNNINSKSLDGTWKNMFEKEIKKVKDRNAWTIGLGKKDGDVIEGKCFILYPHEMEEIQQTQSKYESLKGDYNQLNEKYIQSNETSKSLREELNKERETNSQLTSKINDMEDDLQNISTLEEEISNLKQQLEETTSKNDSLHEEINGLNSRITSMRIQHNEEMDDLVSRYNESVDMIHSLISTTSLLKGDSENMGWTKRTFHYKDNLNAIFDERNMNNLIEQHLINEDSQIPEKTTNKH